jgi:AraC family transcriptional regulator
MVIDTVFTLFVVYNRSRKAMDLTSDATAGVWAYSALHADGLSSADRQRPHAVQLSSRGLGWGPLNFERRDYRAATRALTRASEEHLIFVALAAGSVLCEADGRRTEHQLSPGCVALVPAGTLVRWSWSTRISVALLRLERAFVDRVAHSEFGLAPRDFRLSAAERAYDAAVSNIAGVLAREAMRGERGGKLYAEALAGILAVHLLRHYAQLSGGGSIDRRALSEAASSAPAQDGGSKFAPQRAVSEALEFIHANYAREVTLADIASAVHLSPFHLARLFKQRLGVSPHRYLVQVRVDNARWLLSAGSGARSLAEIASAVGFADQSHLTRHFKRVTGMTPSQMRR